MAKGSEYSLRVPTRRGAAEVHRWRIQRLYARVALQNVAKVGGSVLECRSARRAEQPSEHRRVMRRRLFPLLARPVCLMPVVRWPPLSGIAHTGTNACRGRVKCPGCAMRSRSESKPGTGRPQVPGVALAAAKPPQPAPSEAPGRQKMKGCDFSQIHSAAGPAAEFRVSTDPYSREPPLPSPISQATRSANTSAKPGRQQCRRTNQGQNRSHNSSPQRSGRHSRRLFAFLLAAIDDRRGRTSGGSEEDYGGGEVCETSGSAADDQGDSWRAIQACSTKKKSPSSTCRRDRLISRMISAPVAIAGNDTTSRLSSSRQHGPPGRIVCGKRAIAKKRFRISANSGIVRIESIAAGSPTTDMRQSATKLGSCRCRIRNCSIWRMSRSLKADDPRHGPGKKRIRPASTTNLPERGTPFQTPFVVERGLFSPMTVPGFPFPFYLAHRRLMRLRNGKQFTRSRRRHPRVVHEKSSDTKPATRSISAVDYGAGPPTPGVSARARSPDPDSINRNHRAVDFGHHLSKCGTPKSPIRLEEFAKTFGRVVASGSRLASPIPEFGRRSINSKRWDDFDEIRFGAKNRSFTRGGRRRSVVAFTQNPRTHTSENALHYGLDLPSGLRQRFAGNYFRPDPRPIAATRPSGPRSLTRIRTELRQAPCRNDRRVRLQRDRPSRCKKI